VVPGIVAIRPRFGTGPLALLDQVAILVVSVSPRAVVCQLISGAGRVAGVSPVARGIVTPRLGPVVGELVVVVVGERLRRPVRLFGLKVGGRIVGISEVGKRGAGAVGMKDVAEAFIGVVGVTARANLSRPGQVAEARDRAELIGRRIGKVKTKGVGVSA
jgi:hypothetical protein